MNDDASVSRSVSLKESHWEKISAVVKSTGTDRSKYFTELVTVDLGRRGMLSAPSEVKETYEVVREALAIGIQVKDLIEDAIRKGASVK